MTRLAAPVVAAVLAAGLVAAYHGLGGGSYRPFSVANPCAPREWRHPSGVSETLEQVALSTADGAACTLHASREDLVLALSSGDDLTEFAHARGLSQNDAEDAVRDGLIRAVDDAQGADAIGGGLAGTLRSVARHLPIGLVLDILHGASRLIPG